LTSPSPASASPLPLALRALTHLPWNLKRYLAGHRQGWRIYDGVCRRLGWNAASIGEHEAPNGPYAGVRLHATHVNQLWVPAGLYEPWVSTWIVRLLEDTPWRLSGKDVWDVGANIGAITLLAAQHGSGRVLALEPSSQNRALLMRNIGANPALAARIDVLAAGASDEDGEADLGSAGPGAEFQLRRPDVAQWADGGATERIRTVRLDTLVANGHASPGLIKIDVEGAEALVLAGAVKLLATAAPVLIVEVHSASAAQETRRRLTGAGYRVRMIDKDRLVPADQDSYGHWVAEPLPRRQ